MHLKSDCLDVLLEKNSKRSLKKQEEVLKIFAVLSALLRRWCLPC